MSLCKDSIFLVIVPMRELFGRIHLEKEGKI